MISHLRLSISLISLETSLKMDYGVFIAQTLRYAKACAKYTDFITRTLMLKTQLIKQNFHAKIPDRKLHKWHTRSDKAVVMAKFGHDINRIISDLTAITTHLEQQKINPTDHK